MGCDHGRIHEKGVYVKMDHCTRFLESRCLNKGKSCEFLDGLHVKQEELAVVYYALRDEAQIMVSESRRMWLDTPFSLSAIQCGHLFFLSCFVNGYADYYVHPAFQAPKEPSGMQALLAHFMQTYGPLPSYLHPRRHVWSRMSSMASLYPQSRVPIGNFNSNSNYNACQTPQYPDSKTTLPSFVFSDRYPQRNTLDVQRLKTPMLANICINPNLEWGSAPSLEVLKPFSLLVLDGIVDSKSAEDPSVDTMNIMWYHYLRSWSVHLKTYTAIP